MTNEEIIAVVQNLRQSILNFRSLFSEFQNMGEADEDYADKLAEVRQAEQEANQARIAFEKYVSGE